MGRKFSIWTEQQPKKKTFYRSALTFVVLHYHKRDGDGFDSNQAFWWPKSVTIKRLILPLLSFRNLVKKIDQNWIYPKCVCVFVTVLVSHIKWWWWWPNTLYRSHWTIQIQIVNSVKILDWQNEQQDLPNCHVVVCQRWQQRWGHICHRYIEKLEANGISTLFITKEAEVDIFRRLTFHFSLSEYK